MRDLILALIVFGAMPYVIMRPHVGVYMWSWLSYMNPHRLAYGFAVTFPWAYVVAIGTIISLFLSKEKIRVPWNGLLVMWIIFVLWMCFTTAIAIDPSHSFPEFVRTMKIQFMALLTVILIRNRQQLHYLVWVIAMSIGFFGIKGGAFTLIKGGEYLVWGPPDSFIGGNNELALALIMILPLMRYLQLNTENKWVKRGLWAAMGLVAVSIIGSYSRGAFLSGGLMLTVLLLRSRKKAMLTVMALMILPVALSMMPSKWFERMDTISTYEEDASAMGRINAWGFAVNLVKDHPLGGGFSTFRPELFLKYAPNPYDYHDAHSIYFEVLAEHGFVGLAIFLGLGLAALLYCNGIITRYRDRPDCKWAVDLMSMVQVSVIGYSAGGAFLGLAYFDLPYHLIAIIVVTRFILENQVEPEPERSVDHDEQTPGKHDDRPRFGNVPV